MANENLTIEELVYRLVQEGASDLHITAGSRPKLRIHGVLDDIPEYDILTPEMTQRLLYSILDNEQVARFERIRTRPFFEFKVRAIRTNVFLQRGAVEEHSYYSIQYQDSKNLVYLKMFVLNFQLPKGLILVTGTKLQIYYSSFMLDYINETQHFHVLTMEDPIELSIIKISFQPKRSWS